MIETIDWMEIRNIVHTMCNTYITAQLDKNRIAALDLAIKIAIDSKNPIWTVEKILAVAEHFAKFIYTGQVPSLEDKNG